MLYKHVLIPYIIINLWKQLCQNIFLEKTHDNAVILFFAIGASWNGIPEYRLKPWKNMFNENGNDVVHFNVGDYVNECEERDQFMDPSDLFKMAEKVYAQVFKKGSVAKFWKTKNKNDRYLTNIQKNMIF